MKEGQGKGRVGSENRVSEGGGLGVEKEQETDRMPR